MRKLRVTSYKLRIKSIKKSILIFLLLVACYSLLVTDVSADEIRSRAAIVMEASTGRVLYGKNPNLRLPPASTTKLMTAMVALGRLGINDTVEISEKAANVSPVKANLRAGEKVTVETLLYAALIKSANDAAFALAEATAGSEERFVDLMNQKVLALGLSDTRFVNSTGLPGDGQYTTVYDLARMMRHALMYPLIREVINTRASRITTEDGRSIFLKNSNKLLWADDSVLGGKTGYTKKAGHCFVCVSEHDGETLIVALLGTPSRDRLWKESEDLLEKGAAVINGSENPVVYFTKSDYTASIKKASYKVEDPEKKGLLNKKKVKKNIKRSKNKLHVKSKRAKSQRYVKGNNGSGEKGSGDRGE
ncbi:MAG: D-alanyl-D-alanine carboxypeptidase family protein [Thermodesulfovibrionales bacterium]